MSTSAPQKYEFQAEIAQLLEIVTHDGDHPHGAEIARSQRNIRGGASEHTIDATVRRLDAVIGDGTYNHN